MATGHRCIALPGSVGHRLVRGVEHRRRFGAPFLRFKGRILLLGTSFPFDGFEAALKADLTPTVASLQGLEALAETASRLGRREIRIHLKVETGMGRIGVSPTGAAVLFDWIGSHPAVRLEGIYTHFSCADSNPEITKEQLSLLRKVAKEARRRGQKDFVIARRQLSRCFFLP